MHQYAGIFIDFSRGCKKTIAGMRLPHEAVLLSLHIVYSTLTGSPVAERRQTGWNYSVKKPVFFCINRLRDHAPPNRPATSAKAHWHHP